MRPTSLSGEYKGHKLRSMNEFIYAVFLDTVEKVKFVTEPFSLRSPNSSKRKIPDFAILGKDQQSLTLIEVKSSEHEIIDVINDYIKYQYISNLDMVNFGFVIMNRKRRSYLTKLIVASIGEDAWNQLKTRYVENARKNKVFYGFPGKLNPNYGKKHSEKTRKLISEKAKINNVGASNPMYGKTHTLEAKLKIAAKWHDETRKKEMKIKGMLKHISNFTSEQFAEFMEYAEQRSRGISVKIPDFLNFAYAINKDVIERLFGTFDQFAKQVRGVRNEDFIV